MIVGGELDFIPTWQRDRGRLGDLADTPRPSGNGRSIGEEIRHNFAETQRNNGEVISTQPQCRRADEHAEDGGENPGEEHRHPEVLHKLRHVSVAHEDRVGRCQECLGVHTDDEERDIADIQQAGVPHHDVEAHGQQGIHDDRDHGRQ